MASLKCFHKDSQWTCHRNCPWNKRERSREGWRPSAKPASTSKMEWGINHKRPNSANSGGVIVKERELLTFSPWRRPSMVDAHLHFLSHVCTPASQSASQAFYCSPLASMQWRKWPISRSGGKHVCRWHTGLAKHLDKLTWNFEVSAYIVKGSPLCSIPVVL